MRKLTKSLFITGAECQRKLFYQGKPDQYPSSKTDDEFLESLADGGFQVGALAQCYFPEGRLIDSKNDGDAMEQTKAALDAGDCVLFEAAIGHGNLFARVDILRKRGDVIELIEVKAKSFKSSEGVHTFLNQNGTVSAEWTPYLLDIAFQAHVARLQFGHAFKIYPHLMLADKDKTAPADGLNQMFRVRKSDKSENGRRKTEVVVSEKLTPEHLSSPVLTSIDVAAICENIFNETFDGRTFEDWVAYLADAYCTDTKLAAPVGVVCRSCEFRKSNDKTAQPIGGFAQCMQETFSCETSQFADPMIFDLWDNRRVREMLNEGHLFVADLPKTTFAPPANSAEGLAAAERKAMQIHFTQKTEGDGPEYFANLPRLREVMGEWKFPLHFIDFETTTVAIPFVKGQRPYETTAFQFSHHTLDANGNVSHAGECIVAEQGKFPNFDFLRALKSQLEKDDGTVFCFAPHENTVLRHIRKQLRDAKPHDWQELCAFIETLARPGTNDEDQWTPSRKMVDMREVILKHFYDPFTGGSNSIKNVLPAMLRRSEFLQQKYSKPIYGAEGGISSMNFKNHTWVRFENDQVMNPYDLLLELDAEHLADFGLSSIRNGGAALTAYGLLQFEDMSDEARKQLIMALLKYCELDTLAMVMVYEGLREISSQ